MERQEFDLNEYSLEVKDGKAVVEWKEKGFKDGDFLCDDDGNVFIFQYSMRKKEYGVHVLWIRERDLLSLDGLVFVTSCARHAKEEEKAFLLGKISDAGYVWDAEKKELREKRWRAKMGEVYYAVCVSHAVYVLDYIEGGVSFDDRCFETGNYFRTKEQAEKVAEEVRKVFEKYKEEQK